MPSIKHSKTSYPRLRLVGDFLGQNLFFLAVLVIGAFFAYHTAYIIWNIGISLSMIHITLILSFVFILATLAMVAAVALIYMHSLKLTSSKGFVLQSGKITNASAFSNDKTINILEEYKPADSIEIFSTCDFEAVLPSKNLNFELASCFKQLTVMHDYVKFTDSNRISSLKAPNLKELLPNSSILKYCKKAILPSLITIPSKIFEHCDGLQLEARSLKRIRKNAFSQCKFDPKSLLNLPSLSQIDKWAFYNSSNLSLNAPHTFLNIGEFAFTSVKNARIAINSIDPPPTFWEASLIALEIESAKSILYSTFHDTKVNFLKVKSLNSIDDFILDAWARNPSMTIFAYDACKHLFEFSALHEAYIRGRRAYQQFKTLTYQEQEIDPNIALDLMLIPHSSGNFESQAVAPKDQVTLIDANQEKVILSRYEDNLYRFERHSAGNITPLSIRNGGLSAQ
jgi:hypothetical protein